MYVMFTDRTIFYYFQDLHCHLTTSEVTGYVAGKWDPTMQRESLLFLFLITNCLINNTENKIYKLFSF